MSVRRTVAVGVLVACLLTGCKSEPEPGAASAASVSITAACTLPEADAAPTNLKATVPGVGDFGPAAPEEGKAHSLVATHDPTTRTARVAFELRLAAGQQLEGDMITFEFDHAGSREEASVRVGN